MARALRMWTCAGLCADCQWPVTISTIRAEVLSRHCTSLDRRTCSCMQSRNSSGRSQVVATGRLGSGCERNTTHQTQRRWPGRATHRALCRWMCLKQLQPGKLLQLQTAIPARTDLDFTGLNRAIVLSTEHPDCQVSCCERRSRLNQCRSMASLASVSPAGDRTALCDSGQFLTHAPGVNGGQ
jgi:hypothetical protein